VNFKSTNSHTIFSDKAKDFLFRALFADDQDSVEDQIYCDVSGGCAFMTLNRGGSVCAPGQTTMVDEVDVVQLNVGGSRYATTKGTLITREPDCFFGQALQVGIFERNLIKPSKFFPGR
jgi:hypothetical protein